MKTGILRKPFRRLGGLSVLGLLAVFSAFPTNCASAEAGRLFVAGPPVGVALESVQPLPNGVEFRRGELVIRVVALRDDVLRVRLAPHGEFPEDASWAVSDEVRRQTVETVPETTPETVGFHTKALRVRIERSTLRLTVLDLQDHVIQEDEAGWPADFHGGAFRLYKHMPPEEHFFGLGDKVGPLDRRGQAFRMWNTDAFHFQESTDPIYKDIPFFITMLGGRCAGVFLDNTWPSSFDFGATQRGIYSFGAENGPIDYYVFYGPDPKQVVRTYAWLTGLPALPPLWALGFQQSRFTYETDDRLREIATRLRKDKIPSDVLYLDIDFQKDRRPFTVNTDHFPHFAQLLADLQQEHFHVVVITDLHVAKVPDSNYAPYDSGMRGDHFVRNRDGSTYVGSVWPGPAVFPEFTRAKTRDWWGTLYKDFRAEGVAGFWNDMNEPSIFLTPLLTMPDDAQHRIEEPGFAPRRADHAEIHNVYGMENSRATYEGLRKLDPDLRPFVLTRATYAGGQRYAATWTGDNTSTWNHLRLTTPMLLNLGLSGFGLCGADVGGFIGTPSPELLTRWTELASFQPIDRNHTNKGSGDKEVWVHGPEQEAIRRRYIEERYRLLPYLYTLVEELTRSGIPIVRPLFLEFPGATDDLHPLDDDVGNEFMLGADLLVAPPPFPEQPDSYAVRLPPGIWYDYWSGAKVPSVNSAGNHGSDGPTIRPTIDTLPVFVKAGAIIPMQPLVQSTDETPRGPLTLRVFPGDDCHGSLYLDDGVSMAYQRGDMLRMEFTCEMAQDGLRLHLGQHRGAFHPWWNQIAVEVYGWDATAAEVTLAHGGSNVPHASIDSARHVLNFTVNDDGQAIDLQVRSSR